VLVVTNEPLPVAATCVLVIDDGLAERDLMKRFLTKEGFYVRTASGGEEGLRLAREIRPAAITLDVMMPDMDGWTVLSVLKADPELCEIPVIILSIVYNRRRGFTLGGSYYATNPVHRDGLSQILKKYAFPSPPYPVLLVEDDAATRRIVRSMLEKDGWNVSEARNGSEALEHMERERTSLILLDLMMPVMDGFEFAARVRKHDEWRSIPIVVMTAHDLSGEDLMRLNGFVEKIIPTGGGSREALQNQIRDLLLNCTSQVSAPGDELMSLAKKLAPH